MPKVVIVKGKNPLEAYEKILSSLKLDSEIITEFDELHIRKSSSSVRDKK